MSDEPRERVCARFDPGEIAQVRAYADTETDGNLSLMLRLLVREALTARARSRRKVTSP